MPFISEEIWHSLRDREEGEDLIISAWPTGGNVNQELMKRFEATMEVISNIRNIRKQNNIANKIQLDLFVKINQESDEELDAVIQKMGTLSKLEYVKEKISNSFSFMVKNNEFFIPFGTDVNVEEEKKKFKVNWNMPKVR